MQILDKVKQRIKPSLLALRSKSLIIKGLFLNEKELNITSEKAAEIIGNNDNNKKNPFDEIISPLPNATIDLSIIIPVYNGEKYLRTCLDSILSQKTKCKYEVICINDGSTDKSNLILDEYKSQYDNLIVVTQNNSGISAARNTGLENAHGAYVGFMDNDDSVEPTYIESLWQRAYQEDVDIVQVGYKAVDLNNVEHFRYLRNNTLTKDATEISKICSGYIWSGIYKKSLLAKVRFPKGYWYEDMITRLLIMRLARSFAFIGEPLYIKLLHDNNAAKKIWNAGNQKCLDQFYLAKYCADYGKNKLCLPNDQILFKQLMYEYTAMLRGRTCELSENLRKAVFIKASNDLIQRFPTNMMAGNKLYSLLYTTMKMGQFSKWCLFSKALALKSN